MTRSSKAVIAFSILPGVIVCILWILSYHPESVRTIGLSGSVVVFGIDWPADSAERVIKELGGFREFAEEYKKSTFQRNEFAGVKWWSGYLDEDRKLQLVTFNAPSGWEIYALEFPYFHLFIISLVIPALFIFIFRKNIVGIGKSLCAGCGHDVRASKGRCPECGKTIASPSGENSLTSSNLSINDR